MAYYDVTHLARDVPALDEEAPARLAGRIVLFRSFGKLAFGHLQDRSGRVQVAFTLDELGEEGMERAKGLALGDIVGVDGVRWTTRKGEPTLRVKAFAVLQRTRAGFPDKWAGITDVETRYRKRYLELTLDRDARERFLQRGRIVDALRATLQDEDFLEVETPVLQPAASGASARPFVTHHNALDIDLYLRIAPETYLKRLVAGGLDRVFEIARCFRNEGLDPSHLQEFTMLEWYCAYWDHRENMRFTQRLLAASAVAAGGSTRATYQGRELDFGGEWPVVDYRTAVREESGIDLAAIRDVDELAAAMRERGIDVPESEEVSYARLADALYKRTVRPKLVDPCFLVGHPAELVPLACRNPEDPAKLDMFQVVANGWELAKGYSELVDPEEQRARLLEQAGGDDEAMALEEDFIEAMEFGMPPMSGVGVGIDRLTALLTDAPSVRDVVLFPQMRATAAQAAGRPAP
ncbi:MAG TPA: lysine--tRNA ligase [Solirubrobacteraceae bacterium]|nr:lysine--tRNA ligase [Solirubrobacteraceae bacterium]